MGITMGDALTVVAIFFALGFSIWSMTLLATLLGRQRAERARDRIVSGPGRSVFLGAVGGFLWGGFALVLIQQTPPLIKLVGVFGLGSLGCVAAIGLAGIALFVADRIRETDPTFPPFLALVRASTFIVLATITPLLGWFFVGPLLLLASIGGGLHAILSRHPQVAPVTTPDSGGT